MSNTLKSTIASFLGEEEELDQNVLDDNEKEVCDSKTGECYTIRERDDIVERINKKFIIEDGRELLID